MGDRIDGGGWEVAGGWGPECKLRRSFQRERMKIQLGHNERREQGGIQFTERVYTHIIH